MISGKLAFVVDLKCLIFSQHVWFCLFSLKYFAIHLTWSCPVCKCTRLCRIFTLAMWLVFELLHKLVVIRKLAKSERNWRQRIDSFNACYKTLIIEFCTNVCNTECSISLQNSLTFNFRIVELSSTFESSCMRLYWEVLQKLWISCLN